MRAMKQIHVWRSHVAIPEADVVMFRAQDELLSHTLENLARLGFDTRDENVEVHDGVLTA
jgi:hypothetical protein